MHEIDKVRWNDSVLKSVLVGRQNTFSIKGKCWYEKCKCDWAGVKDSYIVTCNVLCISQYLSNHFISIFKWRFSFFVFFVFWSQLGRQFYGMLFCGCSRWPYALTYRTIILYVICVVSADSEYFAQFSGTHWRKSCMFIVAMCIRLQQHTVCHATYMNTTQNPCMIAWRCFIFLFLLLAHMKCVSTIHFTIHFNCWPLE